MPHDLLGRGRDPALDERPGAALHRDWLKAFQPPETQPVSHLKGQQLDTPVLNDELRLDGKQSFRRGLAGIGDDEEIGNGSVANMPLARGQAQNASCAIRYHAV